MDKSSLLNRIRQDKLLKPGGRYVIALSGGCDSMSLLVLLDALRKKEGFLLWAVHVNHGIRKEAPEDEAFCLKQCCRLGIPLIIYRENVPDEAASSGQGIEEYGRMIRYRRLVQAAELVEAEAVLTAHHRQDQAETLLLNLIRGSGLPGLKAMRQESPLTERIALIRPLLYFPREELEEFLKAEGQSWREDASNQDDSFRRNHIRLHGLPALKEAEGEAEKHLAETASRLAEVHDFMEQEAEDWILQHKNASCLPIDALAKAHPALQFYIWRSLLKESGLKDITALHYKQLKALPYASSGTLAELPGGRLVGREQENIRLLYEEEPIQREDDIFLDIKCFPWEPSLKIPDTPYTKWLDYAIMKDDVCLRHRKPGDYFYLSDHHRKSLARYMVDEKIPLGIRDDVWLLARGSHILWIIGYRLCHKAKISEKTKTVARLRVCFEGEEYERTCGKTITDRRGGSPADSGIGPDNQPGL